MKRVPSCPGVAVVVACLVSTCALLISGCAAFAQSPPAMRVTLLGTGTPLPLFERFGPATLVEAGTEKLLFDCGRGCSIRLFQKGVTLRDAKLFLTHLHSDHTVGIPDLWLTGWLPTTHMHDLTSKPFWIAGPAGTTEMMQHLQQAYAGDLKLRPTQGFFAPPSFTAREITAGVVFESGGVTVTAFDVDHGPGVTPAYGYRVDYAGRSVVLSGDAKNSANVIRYGTGVDVLIHDVALVTDPAFAKTPFARSILALHASPQEAGQVFAQAKPRLAVYSHYVVAGRTGETAPPAEAFVAATRETYSGPLVAGEDLMTIAIGETVSVEAPVSPASLGSR